MRRFLTKTGYQISRHYSRLNRHRIPWFLGGQRLSWVPGGLGKNKYGPRVRKGNLNKPIIVHASHATSAGTGFLIGVGIIILSPVAYMLYMTYNSREFMYQELLEPEKLPIFELTPLLERSTLELEVLNRHSRLFMLYPLPIQHIHKLNRLLMLC